MTDLPPNVYRLPQSRFDAIPGSPWVYWVNDNIRSLFERLPNLGSLAQVKQGLATAENSRFLRYWWEVGISRIGFGCRDRESALKSHRRWFPYMKGGGFRRWYGNQDAVVNWKDDGKEIRNFFDEKGYLRSRPQNTDYYYKEGITYSYLTSGSFSVRYSPGGYIFDVAGSSLFPLNIPLFISVLNSSFAAYALKLINPTVNFQIGDLARLPMPISSSSILQSLFSKVTRIALLNSFLEETTYQFLIPPNWRMGINLLNNNQGRLYELEYQINNEVFRLYGINSEDRQLIRAELNRNVTADDGFEASETIESSNVLDEEAEIPVNNEELGLRWISYSLGIVLGRFKPGYSGQIGSGIYCQHDFSIGSLPSLDEAEFNEIIGPPERFAYIDETGGRHVFPREVEEKLRALADSDGIAVLDQGHPDDLPAKVETALELMLGETGAAEVIAAATGESHDLSKALRRFLERDFFTKHHLKMYRKRPVYWLLQSPQRLYGLYLFHERLTRDTLFVLQRQYVDRKINLTRQQLAEQRIRVEKAATARERRELNKQAEDLERLLLDVEEFARRLKAITDRGYTPHIDDGVILNMSPLWEVIPSWSKEPKKYWEGLENGDYDWAHLAMDYRPNEVREKCRTDKSLAIAHGHEEWFEG